MEVQQDTRACVPYPLHVCDVMYKSCMCRLVYSVWWYVFTATTTTAGTPPPPPPTGGENGIGNSGSIKRCSTMPRSQSLRLPASRRPISSAGIVCNTRIELNEMNPWELSYLQTLHPVWRIDSSLVDFVTVNYGFFLVKNINFGDFVKFQKLVAHQGQ